MKIGGIYENSVHLQIDSRKMNDTKFQFEQYVKSHDFSKIVIFTDEVVGQLYGDYFDEVLPEDKLMVTIPASELTKKVSTCDDLWSLLAENEVDKWALWVNFGGGTVSDIGGFVASTYKRGLRMVNYPTTLLAMVDAAIGGKNGININTTKNMVGTFHFPDALFVDTSLLATLPREELLSGFAELLKYGLIYDVSLWNQLTKLTQIANYQSINETWIDRAATIKQEIVSIDPFDRKERRIFNFGHTLGHAFESFFANTTTSLSHGHAVAIGMLYESYLSLSLQQLSTADFLSILSYIRHFYTLPHLSHSAMQTIVTYCFQDKKRKYKHIEMPLLMKIGHTIPIYDVSEEQITPLLTINFNDF